MNPEWLHVIFAAIGIIFGGLSGLVAGVWRVAQIEGRLKMYFQNTISAHERKFEERVSGATHSFDETLKGLREKINLVEKDVIKNYVIKDDFNDFRAEYRQDMRDLKQMIAKDQR